MPPATARTRTVRVLIADDDPIVRQAVRAVLESDRAVIVAGEAQDGKVAAELAAGLQPDVLLLDLLMPNLPGLETLRAIGSAGHDLRALLLCSSISNRQVLEALQLGARGVVLKNDVAHLLPAIHAIMNGHYWVGGRRVSNVVQVVQDLMQSTAGEAAPARRFGLTARELEIIEFITQGSTNKDIATRLKISEETVKRHLTNIFNKVGMSNRLELALFAIEHKLAPG
jgi:DNA-binding NarL/FixJ family response regulator